MDVAIQFEKYSLDEFKFVFKPVGIMKGEYYESSDAFINEIGIQCHSLSEAEYYDNDFFGYGITMEDLKEKYGDGSTEADMLASYFEEIQNKFYFGYIKDSGGIVIIEIPFNEVMNVDVEQNDYEYEYENREESDISDDAEIYFSTAEVMALKNANSIEEVRNYLAVVLSAVEKEKERVIRPELPKPNKKKLDRAASKKFNLAKLRKEVLSKIVAQDEAVMKLTTTLGVNYTSKNPKNKSHILIIGPSGTGKTEMVNVVADYLGVPFFKADATAYSKEGYVGKSVYSMLNGLVNAANGDIEKAQNGILIIDEIDKKAGNDTRDVSAEVVLYSLLKMMDRTVIEVDSDTLGTFEFDTSNLTIICMGAFSGLYKSDQATNPLGFESKITKAEKNIGRKDLIAYGMTSEFIGRIDNIIFTKNFTLDDIVEILYKSKLSPIKSEREWFKDQGIVTVFKKTFYQAIANKCLSSDTGARNIKSLVKDSLVDAHDVALTQPKVKKLIFTADTVNDSKKFSII